ncbi:hypothetical protein Tco_0854782 [Tanacetum coccineum]
MEQEQYSASRFHVAFSPTISAGGGGARRENATHDVVFAPWAGVYADGSSHQPPWTGDGVAGDPRWWLATWCVQCAYMNENAKRGVWYKEFLHYCYAISIGPGGTCWVVMGQFGHTWIKCTIRKVSYSVQDKWFGWAVHVEYNREWWKMTLLGPFYALPKEIVRGAAILVIGWKCRHEDIVLVYKGEFDQVYSRDTVFYPRYGF